MRALTAAHTGALHTEVGEDPNLKMNSWADRGDSTNKRETHKDYVLFKDLQVVGMQSALASCLVKRSQ